MRVLGWYTVLFNLIVIAMFILHAAGRIETPPFTALEDLLWALFSVPVVILGAMATRYRK
jgi:hypothetical protein